MYNQIHIYLVLSIFMVSCGIYGVIRQSSLFGMLLSAKIIFLAAALNFSVFNHFIFKDKGDGNLFSFVIVIFSISSMIVIASFILAYYRDNRNIDTDL
ncbi:MAG: hypothetical protein GY714_22460 [Desulfobacterales bacterium]|nr:hypothetical protein [Desulfobacterales bacterium]